MLHRTRRALLATTALTLALAAPAFGAADVKVTEVAPWGSATTTYGQDWFELTNKGDAAATLTGWKVDDDSNAFGSAVALSGVTTLAPGASAIFLENGTTSVDNAFRSSWFGASTAGGVTFGAYAGSGVGLGANGDQVNVFTASGTKVTGTAFGASTTGVSFDNAAGAATVTAKSVAGTNGAFLSPGGETGSPGTIVNGGGTTGPGGPGTGPTIALAGDDGLSAALADPANPTIDVAVGQAGADPSTLTVAATASSNPAVAAAGGVTVSGSGATRTVAVTPAGAVGTTSITLRVTGAGGATGTVELPYAVSTGGSATTRYYTGASDGSTAIEVGDGYILVADDESNTLRLYSTLTSGRALKSWDFSAQIGVSATDPEIDIEGATRRGSTIWWTGSLGNSKSGNLRPNRSFTFSTTVTGTGAATDLAFRGATNRLRGDLIAWDQANGNRFGFAAGAASGQIAKQVDGFNVEGLELAPGTSGTAYVGFRAPLSPASASGKALVVPVTNFTALAGAGASPQATFGTPILWDLGGLSIREIRKNAADQYLIVAGSYTSGGTFALYRWTGDPADAPVRYATPLPTGLGDAGAEDPGSWEGIATMPADVTDGASVRLLMDNGSTDLYGTGQEAKSVTPTAFRKSRSEQFTLTADGAPTAAGARISRLALTRRGVLSLRLSSPTRLTLLVERRTRRGRDPRWRRSTLVTLPAYGRTVRLGLGLKRTGTYRVSVRVGANRRAVARRTARVTVRR